MPQINGTIETFAGDMGLVACLLPCCCCPAGQQAGNQNMVAVARILGRHVSTKQPLIMTTASHRCSAATDVTCFRNATIGVHAVMAFVVVAASVALL
jgi:hypothetical protein